MKIRLMGLIAEVATVLQALNDTGTLDLIKVSDPYLNGGDSRLVRIYIEAQLRAAEEQLRDEICPYCEDSDRWP
jgi:hypothetical protein